MELKLSFSQGGEDIILNGIFGYERKLFYVDVGCNDPIRCSNTLSMYINGGKGICIDANSFLIDKFKRIRRRDIAINAVISNEEKDVTYHLFHDDLINTIEPENLVLTKNMSTEIKSEKRRTKTLTSILKEELSATQKINVLSIDVEGHDYNVLQSIDLEIYRPELIIIEIHYLKIVDAEFRNHKIIQYLRKFDYSLKYYAGMNAYFIDNTAIIC